MVSSDATIGGSWSRGPSRSPTCCGPLRLRASAIGSGRRQGRCPAGHVATRGAPVVAAPAHGVRLRGGSRRCAGAVGASIGRAAPTSCRRDGDGRGPRASPPRGGHGALRSGDGPGRAEGAALAEEFYPDRSWRTYGDLDVLIPAEAWASASAVLSNAGFVRLLPEPRPGFDLRGKGLVRGRAGASARPAPHPRPRTVRALDRRRRPRSGEHGVQHDGPRTPPTRRHEHDDPRVPARRARSTRTDDGAAPRRPAGGLVGAGRLGPARNGSVRGGSPRR